LIQYAILYNKSDLVELLIKKECKIDIYDNDGRSILFNPIKYNYLEIVKILLEYEKNNIGVTISQMQDNNGYYPIHYAIFFKNLEVLNIFSEKELSFDELDNSNNTPLHLAIKSKNKEIFNLVLSKCKEIDFQTLEGETPLHLACNFEQDLMLVELIKRKANINVQDFNNEITPLICLIFY
jgi:ankyrin repeat protein